MLEKFFQSISEGFKTFWAPREPYVGVFPFTLLASQALSNQRFDLALDQALVVYAIGRGSTGLFSFLLKTAGANVLLGSAQIRSDALWGTTHPILYLRRPFAVSSKSYLTVDLTDLSAAGNSGQIVLLGYLTDGRFPAE